MKVYKIFAIILIILCGISFYLYRDLKRNFFELRAMGSKKENIYGFNNFIIFILTIPMIILFILNI